nr:hypothetical protein [Tanacetum cinerariifolium]
MRFFPPSKTTNLRNEIKRFQQRFDESFSEAWDHFNDMLRACPHHGFSELHQLDTFYNALNINDQDSLNSAAGGNFLDKMPADCLKIIEQIKIVSSDVAELKDMVRALLLDKKNQYSAQTSSPTPALIKAVKPNCVTCSGTHAYQNCPATCGNIYQDNIQEYVSQAATTNYSQGNTGFRPQMIKTEVEIPTNLTSIKANLIDPRRDNERRRDQANKQIKKFYEIFKEMSFEISFTDALMLMPKFASTLKALIGNKEKLSEMARTLMNEHYSVVILNKLPKKLGDPSKFLIPCEFSGMDECLALADLGASINLMPLSVWKGLSLPELAPTCMTLKLADQTESKPVGIAKDVKVKVGVFHFPADFVVVDFKPDPRVPLILGSPTPSDDPIISTTSPMLTPFGDSDFLLFEEADAFLDLEDDPDSPELDPSYYDPEGDILSLEAILNSDPSPPLPNHEQYVPSFKEELKACEAKTIKSSIDEPPEVELKDLPPHLEYAFLESDNKLPVIIAKALRDEEKSALIKILIEEDYKPAVQNQRRVNLKIYDVIKKEVEKLLDAGLIYPVSDSPWVSPRTSTIASSIVSLGTSKFALTHMIRKRLHPHAPTGRSPIVACLSVYAMHRARFKGDTPFIFSEDCIQAFQTLKKKLTEAPILIALNLDMPFELMCDARNFAIGAVLGQQHEKHFWPIHYASKTLTDAESNYTTTEKEMLAVVYAFEKFQSYLIMNKCIVHTDHSALKYLFAKKDAKARLLRWVLLLQEFDFTVIDTKGAENLAADHLSRLENPYENVLDPKEINENFPLETLSVVTSRGDSGTPWFADFANYHAGNFLVKGLRGSSDSAVCARQRSSQDSRSLPQWTHGGTSWC